MRPRRHRDGEEDRRSGSPRRPAGGLDASGASRVLGGGGLRQRERTASSTTGYLGARFARGGRGPGFRSVSSLTERAGSHDGRITCVPKASSLRALCAASAVAGASIGPSATLGPPLPPKGAESAASPRPASPSLYNDVARAPGSRRLRRHPPPLAQCETRATRRRRGVPSASFRQLTLHRLPVLAPTPASSGSLRPPAAAVIFDGSAAHAP